MTALLGAADQAWADDLRRAHYPAERNQLPAHLTLFHHLPPSALDPLKRILTTETRNVVQPMARVTRLIALGQGVALGIDSPGLAAIRSHVADAFADQLTAQDRAAWRPHITIQNKAPASTARVLLNALRKEFQIRPIEVTGLAAYWYRGGPWEPIATFRFSRSGRSRRS